MAEEQLDFFSDAPGDGAAPVSPGEPALAVEALDDEALIAAIPSAGLNDSDALAAEAARRGLASSVPALRALLLRFTGFGGEALVPEQIAALHALAKIGGPDAAQAVAHAITRGAVRGATLGAAVDIAGRLDAQLPVDVVAMLLQHPDPRIRVDACRLARPAPVHIALLLEIAGSLDRKASRSAACVLGRMGRPEARPALLRLLREDPSAVLIESVSAIADEECIVLLGRIARSRPDLADVVLTVLDDIDDPRAGKLAAGLRNPPET